MADITKLALAASLKKLLSRETLERITVADIAEDCGINRQTFYYHFHDIYGLLEWIYQKETIPAIGKDKTSSSWQKGLVSFFEYIQENREFVYGTYRSVGREYLETFLERETRSFIMNVIKEKAAGMSICAEDKAFIADFYKYAFSGIILDWISANSHENPEHIVARLNTLIRGSIDKALEQFSHDK